METQNAYKDAKSAASKGLATVGDKLKNGADDLSSSIKNADIKSHLSDLKATASDLKAAAEDKLGVGVDFVKKYPISTLLGATAVGFIVGKLLTSSRRD